MKLMLLALIILNHYANGQAFTLCAYGHTTHNKYIAGKTTYFKSQPTRWTTLWTSYNHPPETPNMTYIYEDFSHNTSCWVFGTTSTVWNIINEVYDQITTFATCSVCGIASVPYPEQCPLWNIAGYGLDSHFQISTNEVCQADHWNDSIDRPLSVCSWNISSDEYYFMNDETWHLYTVDTNNKTYYYNSDDVKYIYQYHNPSTDRWLWAVSDFVGDTNYKIFCEMAHSNQDISHCETWHFYDKQTSQFQSNNHMILQSSECPIISDIVCVYGSSKTQLNGEYEAKPYANDYDGWKKDNLYLLYRDLSWYITSVDVSIIYASCKSFSPYNPMECNHKWRVYDQSSLRSTTDTLKVWNSTCDTVPTSLPTTQPTSTKPTASPTNHPTSTKPTASPTYIPTMISSLRSTVDIPDTELTDTTKSPTTSTDVIVRNEMNLSESIESTDMTALSVPPILFKDYYDDSESATVLSTDTFVVMLGIGVIIFICFFFGLCGILYYCRRSKKDKTRDNNYVYEQPRFRETIDEYMTQHLQEKVDRCLQKSAGSMGINHKTSMHNVYPDRNQYVTTPPSHFNNEGKPLYDNNRLYPQDMEDDNTHYIPTAAPWNDDAMTQSFASGGSPQQQQYVARRMTNEAHCEYSSESMDINSGVHMASYEDHMHKYDDITRYETESETDVDKKNSKTHLYHIVIDEDDVLNEEEFNRQIDAHHEQGILSRKSIGDQSVHSRITDASFGSNQTEEKEDHAFYNIQKYKMSRLHVSGEPLSKQPIEAAVFPDAEDVEGAETIETVVIKPTEENRARESVKLSTTVSSPSQNRIGIKTPVMERKSLNMTKRGYMDEECEKPDAVDTNNNNNENEALLNMTSPRRHDPPPNSEIHSPSSMDNEDTIGIDMDTILDLKHTPQQHAQDNKHRKSMELQLTPKGQTITSMSRRSGRSFVTLFDEKKEIEADHLDIDSDDTCIDLEDVDEDTRTGTCTREEDELDLDMDHEEEEEYLDESNTDDLSKQLFGSHSVVTTLTDIPEVNTTATAPPAAFQHTLQSHDIMHQKYYNHSHNHIAFKRINSNSVNNNSFATQCRSASPPVYCQEANPNEGGESAHVD